MSLSICISSSQNHPCQASVGKGLAVVLFSLSFPLGNYQSANQYWIGGDKTVKWCQSHIGQTKMNSKKNCIDGWPTIQFGKLPMLSCGFIIGLVSQPQTGWLRSSLLSFLVSNSAPFRQKRDKRIFEVWLREIYFFPPHFFPLLFQNHIDLQSYFEVICHCHECPFGDLKFSRNSQSLEQRCVADLVIIKIIFVGVNPLIYYHPDNPTQLEPNCLPPILTLIANKRKPIWPSAVSLLSELFARNFRDPVNDELLFPLRNWGK